MTMIALPTIAVRCFCVRRAAWAVCLVISAASAHAEDGYDLWLRYRPVEAPWAMRYRSFATEVVSAPGANLAAQELLRGMAGLLAVTPVAANRITRDGAIVLRTSGAAADRSTDGMFFLERLAHWCHRPAPTGRSSTPRREG